MLNTCLITNNLQSYINIFKMNSRTIRSHAGFVFRLRPWIQVSIHIFKGVKSQPLKLRPFYPSGTIYMCCVGWCWWVRGVNGRRGVWQTLEHGLHDRQKLVPLSTDRLSVSQPPSGPSLLLSPVHIAIDSCWLV